MMQNFLKVELLALFFYAYKNISLRIHIKNWKIKKKKFYLSKTMRAIK